MKELLTVVWVLGGIAVVIAPLLTQIRLRKGNPMWGLFGGFAVLFAMLYYIPFPC